MPDTLSTNLSRPVSMALLALGLVGALALLVWPYSVALLTNVCTAVIPGQVERCANAPSKLVAYLAMISFFPLALILERIIPAARNQRLFSVGLLTDFFWFCCAPIFLVALVIPVEELLSWLYAEYLQLRSFTVIGPLPLAVQFVVVILLSDFVGWFAHWVRHKSSIVWKFHVIHHSQEEMNCFTTSRIHPFDFIAISLVRFIPFAALDLRIAVPAFVVWTGIARAYDMFTHSNLHTNLGPLKYILVTPQSHRIHHSPRPEHQDKNYGNVFSIWDFLFGTQVLDFNVYPETGTPDQNVPQDQKATTVFGAIQTVFEQILYPFKTFRKKLA